MILNDAWVVNLKKPAKKWGIRKKPKLSAVGPTMRFRRYEPLPSHIPLGGGIPPGPEQLRYEDIEVVYDARTLSESLRQSQMEYNKRKAKQAQQYEDLVRLKDIGCPMPPLSEMLRPYEFNKIRRKKQMFNEDEIKFIGETANRDLVAVNSKVEDMVNQLARLGKNLSDLKVVQSRLISIVQAIKDEQEDEGNCNRRCC